MKRYSRIIPVLSAGLLLFLLTSCTEPETVPREIYKQVTAENSQLQSSVAATKRQLEEAQQTIARKQQERDQLEGRVKEAQAAVQNQQQERAQTERQLKDAERIIARQETSVSRAERGQSIWKTGSALLFILAVALLLVGAAAGSAIRKEVTHEQQA